MNSNGVRVFARAYNAASTSGNPATVAIQIGKNFKGTDLQAFGVTSKTTPLCTELFIYSNDTLQFGTQSFYDEKTGVLFLDAGYNYSSSVTTRRFALDQPNNVAYNDGYFVINASKSPALVGVPQVLPRIATLSDVKASGTAGGANTASTWQTRTLNTLSDTSAVVTSLSSNQFILPAGEYYIEADAPAYQTRNSKIKLRNITDSTDSIIGITGYTWSTSSVTTNATLKGSIVITSPKTFEIQHWTGLAFVDGFGLAASSGISEVYTQVKITLIKR
jgi:hypothetical protein